MIAVIFEANSHLDKQARYLEIASELRPLLERIDGFIAIERFQSLLEPGKILSLSWWRDEESVLAWKKNVFHQEAQAEGRESIFSYYRIRVAHVFRDYSSENRGK
ncbi:antibiotic biosynthesis monooxygenase [Hafnia paralvei]|uniref:antibiotic biosynthesis monooxygenase family protein n=1 Tax=Hafnia TaxID=568 RepID=UPI00058651FE|nr:antibiotic biosynthesis monooxygenase [Hafnia paralvei]MDU1190784.1 antibiotic biosynthesis monooxygenase [Enterobacteriaceae bacterium]MCQ4168173.1 antibiotic biosynthesis monooxygenase [Hafnia paralvei]MDU1243694.1 antibiotic biosynthesis monooxygenase [Enterobacteriaceae bacterium]MDX6839352.1 antibiotic biosynthesis monooxygenase [Hafnia paralvei]MDX6909879.1 antibiotic biosynthesis monooxygenase [Hafnia paralvei]